MGNYSEVVLWLQDTKLTALKSAMKQQSSTVEQALSKALETLYEQTVPADVRSEIEAKLAAQERAEAEENARKQAEQYREFGVQIIVDGVLHQWKKPTGTSVLQVASALRKALRQNKFPADTAFDSSWTPVELIMRDEFDKLSAGFFSKERAVTGAFVLDFDHMTFCFAQQGHGWLTYHMKDVSTAVYVAERKKGLPPERRLKLFEEHLGSKTIDYRPWRGAQN